MKKTNLILALIVSSLGFSQTDNTIYKNNSPSGTDSNETNSVILGNVYGASSSNGSHNVYVGDGVEANGGVSNVTLGSGGFYSGNNNVTIGQSTAFFADGDKNITIGNFAFDSAGGDSNIAIGDSAGNQEYGDSNIFMGKNAGNQQVGDNNIYLGKNAGYSTGGDKNILIGIGVGSGINLFNKLMIDSNSSTTQGNNPLIYGDLSTKQLAIGTMELPTNPNYKLAVDGNIVAEELLVDVKLNWPDYVFKTDYKLASLKQVEQHIAEKGHLANIPSAKEVEEKGILVGDMNAKLLRKVEELTLYTIDQQKQIEELKLLVNTLVTNKK